MLFDTAKIAYGLRRPVGFGVNRQEAGVNIRKGC